MALFGPATDDRDPSGDVRKLRAALDEKVERLAQIKVIAESARTAVLAGISWDAVAALAQIVDLAS